MHNCKIIFARLLSFIIILTLLGLSQACDRSQERGPLAKPVIVNVQANLEQLIYEEDTDGDKKITVRDCPIPKTERGNKRFWLSGQDGKRYEVAGTYFLANLLQELALAQKVGRKETKLDPNRIFEKSPVARISRSIREINWDKLTRRIDLNNLGQMLHDEKTANTDYRYVYVPYSDKAAYNYFVKANKMFPNKTFPTLKVRVERLPAQITPEYVRSLDGKHGLLVLAIKSNPNGDHVGVPFVVPGGRFNEMYGWDSYFMALGLLADGRVDLARGMVDNLVYQIEHYGKILNANRTYYLTRSQPPFLTSMALAVYENLPPSMEKRPGLKRFLPQPSKSIMGSGWIRLISRKPA